jgi:asparagine synthase (glutamine-hydrolysing)
MCGIAGVYYFKNKASAETDHRKILHAIGHRGPDHQSFYETVNATLYHSRLSIVDVSESSNQPFKDSARESVLSFNGEIFNYKHFSPNAKGDVEVLYDLLTKKGSDCLNELNGFFAFAFLNKNSLLLARDRFGVKPLYYFQDEEKFAFASELKALLLLTGKQKINLSQLYTYFRLNYCSGPESIFQNIKKLSPGHFIEITNDQVVIREWFTIKKEENSESLHKLLDDAVKLRLHADVPVGCFLSGGIDSSIISALAIKHKKDLLTFSIGFKNEAFFDETSHAEKVAKHIGSNHHNILLSEDDFIDNLDDFLASMDEPFADSSAFNFYMLSQFTSKKVKVALSGDGADELFKGYYKHKAMIMRKDPLLKAASFLATPLLPMLKSSRNSITGNLKRQLTKFNQVKDLSFIEAYKRLASISAANETEKLLNIIERDYFESLFDIKSESLDIETLLDLKIVLADDMLVKADRFSMRHGIEIRNPFLDYRIVQYALNLSIEQKISSSGQKLVLKKNFSPLLPPEIFERKKKGFELPLQKWLSSELQQKLHSNWINQEKIAEEKYLNYNYISQLNRKVCSQEPGDSAAKLWAVIVFQSWLNNYKEFIA